MPNLRLPLILACLWACPLCLTAQYPTIDATAIDEGNGVTIRIQRLAFQHPRPEARTILLLHGGGPGSIASFKFAWQNDNSFATLLARKGFIVYLLNIRGWENSTAPYYDPTDTALVAGSCIEAAADIDTAIGYIRQQEHLQKVNLFGWATGGHWAAYYTTKHNAKVEHLIVLNTLYGVKAPWTLDKAFADPADSNHYNNRLPLYRESTEQQLIDARLNAIPSPDKSAWVDTSGLPFYARTAAMWNGEQTLRVPGGYRKESFYMAHGHLYWNAKDITTPTLILRSQHDFWSRPIDAATFYHDLPDAVEKQNIELRDATHFVFLDKPQKGLDALVAAIDAFIPPPAPSPLTIDALQNDTQVLQFIRGFDGIYHYSFLTPPKPVGGPQNDPDPKNQFGSRPYEKGDFDNNGTTDLLFNGYNGDITPGNLYCRRQTSMFLAYGKDSFRIIEHAPHQKNHQIKELRYRLDYSMGAAKVFDLFIHDDSAQLRLLNPLEHDQFSHNGIFVARLDPAITKNIYGILNYIGFRQLPDKYRTNAVDDAQTGTFEIVYDDNKIKTISDYGLSGSYGLKALHQLLAALLDTQHWKKIAPYGIDDYKP